MHKIGLTDKGILDATLVVGYFNFVNRIVLALGVGFSDEETNKFFSQISVNSNTGDKLLIGFDLKKSPEVILKAYDDPHGHTRRFIFNHLHRLNRELDAAFDPGNFVHHCTYLSFFCQDSKSSTTTWLILILKLIRYEKI